MKKIFGMMLLCATMVGFASCDKDGGEIYYAGKQKEVVDFFSGGTFSNTFAIGDWSSTITFEFSKAYNPPIVGTFEDGRELYYVYGQYRVTYSGSHTTPSSFVRYYWIPLEGNQFCTFARTQGINSTDIHDLQIIDHNTFKIRQLGSSSWDIYKRM